MVPEDLPEGAALSAPETPAPDTEAAEPEAAEGAEGEVAEVVRDRWADLSEEATANPAGIDTSEFPELAEGTTEDPLADSEGAAFGAPGQPQEEARFDALELLTNRA